MPNIDINKIKKVHFIGIGGIGVSAIARMMLLEGKEVGGSDIERSSITDELEKLGAKIFIGHSAENIADDTDLVVYTIAIDRENPELKKASLLGNGITELTYPEMLGLISQNYYTVAVAGTHGKTTTTAMIAKIATDANLNPTVVVGSLLKDSGSNFIAGNPKHNMSGKKPLFIVEACEYRRSFLNLSPNILVITNIEEDHLDYYKDLVDIQNAFSELAGKLGKDDFLICNTNDKNLTSVIKIAKCVVIDYSSKNVIGIGGLTSDTSKLNLKIQGAHNQENAKVALAVARALKISEDSVISSLEKFDGVWRRFEYKGKTEKGALVYDDYAHHPTEIRAILRAMREKFPDKTIIAVIQPHQHSRVKFLLNDFAESFVDADNIIVTPIYVAREKPDKSINNQILADKIKQFNPNTQHMNDFSEIEQYLKKHSEKDDIIITIGAGDIYKIAENMIQ